MANFCGKCGAPLEAGDRFCMQCGEPVKTVDEDLTVPIKSSDEEETAQEASNTTNAPEKKTGLAARAVNQASNKPKETNKNTGASDDDADDVLKQMEADDRQQEKSPDKKTSQPNESKKEPDKPNTVAPKKNGTDQAKTAPPKKNNKTIFIIVGVVLGVIAVGALIYCFATGILPPKSTVPISFKINIDDGFTKDSTPIVAKITDQSDKSKVTYTTFTPEDKNGKEIEMPKGQYEIEMISPVNADCSIYDMGKTVVVDTALEEDRKIDTSCKRIAAENVTSAQIQGIADALKEASGNENADIPEEALTKANDRVKTKQAKEEEQRKAAEKQAAIDNAIAQGYNVYEGTLYYCESFEKFEQYNGYPEEYNALLREKQNSKLPYAILAFDTNQNIGNSTLNTRSCNLIFLDDPNGNVNKWKQYDGKHLTLAVDPTTIAFSTSGGSATYMNPSSKGAHVIFED